MIPNPSRFRRSLFAVAVTLTLAASGCAIPTDENARPVDDVPADLFATTTTVVEAVEPDESEFTMTLFFYNDQQQLVLVRRPVEETPVLGEVLAALSGLTEEELEEQPGLRTTLLSDSPLTVTEIDRTARVLTVSAGDTRYRELLVTESDRLQRIFGQVVCTMTAASGDVDRIRLVDPEGTIGVQNSQDGTVLEGPVGPQNVNDCLTAADLAAETLEAAEGEAETDGGQDPDGADQTGS